MLVSNGMNIYNNGDMMKENCRCTSGVLKQRNPDSKVHGANMGPIWGRQDPVGPPVGPMNFATWEWLKHTPCTIYSIRSEHGFIVLYFVLVIAKFWTIDVDYIPILIKYASLAQHGPIVKWSVKLADDEEQNTHINCEHTLWDVTSYCKTASCLVSIWASYQIRNIAGCTCAGNAGNVFPRRRLQRKPACITARASRTCHNACHDRLPPVAGKTFPAFPAHAHPPFSVSGKRPMHRTIYG